MPWGRGSWSVLGRRSFKVVKLAPVIERLVAEPDVDVLSIATGQHREMLDQTLDAFSLRPDVDLGLMRPDQSLSDLAGAAITSLGEAVAVPSPMR